MIARIACAAMCALSLAAWSQLPDCPKADAPMPTAPPGPPPPFMPPMFTPPATFPATPEALKAASPPSQVRELTPAEIGPGASKLEEDIAKQRANDWLTEAEDGHVSGLLWIERRVRAASLPADQAGGLVDASRTPLAAWRYVGYFDEHQKSRANRLFRSADGSILSLEEWDYKSDGGAIYVIPGMRNRTVGKHPATLTGFKAPSGCVSSSLAWQDDRKDYRLQIAGPLDVEAQRAVLIQVAEAIAAP